MNLLIRKHVKLNHKFFIPLLPFILVHQPTTLKKHGTVKRLFSVMEISLLFLDKFYLHNNKAALFPVTEPLLVWKFLFFFRRKSFDWYISLFFCALFFSRFFHQLLPSAVFGIKTPIWRRKFLFYYHLAGTPVKLS